MNTCDDDDYDEADFQKYLRGWQALAMMNDGSTFLVYQFPFKDKEAISVIPRSAMSQLFIEEVESKHFKNEENE
jgi:hypothetical protein